MSDHNERACTRCGSLLHHEDQFRCDARFLGVEITILRDKLVAAERQVQYAREVFIRIIRINQLHSCTPSDVYESASTRSLIEAEVAFEAITSDADPREPSREVVQLLLDDVDARLAKGKGTWPGPDYVRDDDWARWLGEASALRAVLDAIK